MRDLLNDYERLASSGEQVGRAVVTRVWGSAPRRPGACLLATASGRMAGSISGGCVESATATEIGNAIERGTPKLLEFGVSDETAWDVGLSCGGTIGVLVEPAIREELVSALRRPGGVVLGTVVDGTAAIGASMLIREDGSTDGPLPPPGPTSSEMEVAEQILSSASNEIRRAALEALERELSQTAHITASGAELDVFLEVHSQEPKLVIFGGVHVAAELVKLARPLGYHTVVADGREAFVTRERFPDADELIHAWPEAAFDQIGLDSSTFVCVLTHDPKFDEPALKLALRSRARYVGAIGSRQSQADRRTRLRQAGLSDEQVARLHGPIGLDLGGRSPGEIALAILAEITAVRYGKKLN